MELITVSETNQVVNYNVNLNYNATQKRKLNKVLGFKLTSLSMVEKMFKNMRINGVVTVQVLPKFNPETQLKNENDLLEQAMNKAKQKRWFYKL